MIEQRIADVHGNKVVRLLADQPDNAIGIHLHIVHVFQMADSGQHHHDAVSNQSHPSDYALHSSCKWQKRSPNILNMAFFDWEMSFVANTFLMPRLKRMM